MPGGGLAALVKYGGENQLFNGNPSMTYFNKVFRQYTPFSLESTTLAFEGANEMFYDRPIQLRCKIQRVADLLADAYLVFELPEIYSKFVDRSLRKYQYNFAWVNYIGATIINRITFLIGGQRIQEFDNTYIVAKALTDLDGNKLQKWKNLVGEVPELTNPDLGLYGGGSVSVDYPTVYPNSELDVQTNRPSIPRTTIRVPLPFWFTQDPSLALPLIALQYTECTIELELRPLQDLYTVIDASGSRVRPDVLITASNINNPEFGIDQTIPEFRDFLVDIGASVPPINTLDVRPRLELTYVYLTKAEQKVFASSSHSYLITQVTRRNESGIFNRQQINLNAHNLGKRIFIIPRRSDSIESRNAWYNFTNWSNYPFAPYNPTPDIRAEANIFYSSGLLVPQGQQFIIRGLRFLIEGNELQEEKDTSYYEKVISYKYMKGQHYPGLLLHTFELENDPVQPAGTINFSLIKSFQAEVDVWPLPTFPNYLYNLTFYIETYNFLKISSGIGGLAFAL